MKSVDVPEDKIETFKAYLNFSQYADSSTWASYSCLFKIENSIDRAKSVRIFYNFDSNANKYNVFVIETQSQFPVAEDVFIMKKS